MTVVDAVCPLMTDPESWDLYIEGGVDIGAPTVANWESPAETRQLLEQWARWTDRDDRLVFQRTSYLPGEIAQCDWWQLPTSVPVGGGATRKVYGLVTTLPFSAAHAAVFCQF